MIKSLSSLAIVFWILIGPGCGNEYPIIEFHGAPDSSVFEPGDSFYVEIHAYDPDGLITEYATLSDNSNSYAYATGISEQPRQEITTVMDYTFEYDDTGDHYKTVLVTDDKNASTEKTFHWTVSDFRDPYIGNWFFHTEGYKWDMNREPSMYDFDTIEYEGSISYGKKYYELLVCYSDEDTLKIEYDNENGIIDVPGYSESKSSAYFIGIDSLVLHLVTDALGAGISLDIEGKKH